MLKTTMELNFLLRNYKNPQTKIQRLVKNGKLFPIRRGLYETQKNVPMILLAGSIYGPSYISFAYALAYYDLIPERVYGCTSATVNKNRTKVFHTIFGDFYYRDIPEEAYPYGALWKQQGEYYSYLIASPEKAVCDMLYIQKPVYSMKALEEMLFADLRLDEEAFSQLNYERMEFFCPKYHRITLNVLQKYLRKKRKEG